MGLVGALAARHRVTMSEPESIQLRLRLSRAIDKGSQGDTHIQLNRSYRSQRNILLHNGYRRPLYPPKVARAVEKLSHELIDANEVGMNGAWLLQYLAVTAVLYT